MRSLLLALSLLVAESPANQPVTVRLEFVGASSPSPARVVLHARRVDGDRQELEREADGPATALLLPPGQWFVNAKSAGWWSEPRLVTVGNAPAEVSLELERATKLRARVKLPAPAKASEVTVYLQTLEPQVRARSVSCPVSGDVAECDVPAGTQDIVFRVPGYASLFRWSETLTGPRQDLGTLTFRRGSTFSGRVEAPRGDRAKNARIDVILLPVAEWGENDAYRTRKSAARIVAQPNARGFFAFNVAPGRYIVQARAGDLVSEEEEVTIIEGREAVLRDTLRLEPPRTLTINVHPPLDPWNKPWQVTVTGRNAQGVVTSEKTAPTSAAGSVVFDGRMPATYSVSVHRSSADEWASRDVDLVEDTTLDLTIATTRVRGSVSLGGKPIAALVTFTGNGMRLPVRSKPDGTFLTLLPRVPDDRWHAVDIESADPLVKRTLWDVRLSGADTEEASVDLQLPAATLGGVVVDRSGMPVRDALVTVVSPDGDFKQIESSEGRFAVTGLAPGLYKLSAMTRDLETEAPLEVDLDGEGAAKDVTLIVEPFSRLRGVVRSSFGTVMSASLYVAPAETEPPFIALLPVSADGRFDIFLPPRTEEVYMTANAPGFSFRMMRISVPHDGADAEVAVDQLGGTLTVEMETPHGPLRPYLVHNGVAIRATIVAYLSGAHMLARDEAKTIFEIPQIEAGSYSLCWMSRPDISSAQRCVSGTLARQGTLALRATHAQSVVRVAGLSR